MKRIKDFTPAQAYVKNLIDAIDELTAGTGSADSVLSIVLERPQTLRSALNAHLYKSVNQRRQRKERLKSSLYGCYRIKTDEEFRLELLNEMRAKAREVALTLKD